MNGNILLYALALAGLYLTTNWMVDEDIQKACPDENSRRVGQSVAAASLPDIG